VLAIIKNEIDCVLEQFCHNIFSTGSYGFYGFMGLSLSLYGFLVSSPARIFSLLEVTVFTVLVSRYRCMGFSCHHKLGFMGLWVSRVITRWNLRISCRKTLEKLENA